MNTNDLLNKILSYHQVLVDSRFVEQVIGRIERLHRMRQWILSFCTLAGVFFGFAGLSYLINYTSLTFLADLPGTTTLLSTLAISSVVLFLFWVFNDEFERP